MLIAISISMIRPAERRKHRADLEQVVVAAALAARAVHPQWSSRHWSKKKTGVSGFRLSVQQEHGNRSRSPRVSVTRFPVCILKVATAFVADKFWCLCKPQRSGNLAVAQGQVKMPNANHPVEHWQRKTGGRKSTRYPSEQSRAARARPRRRRQRVRSRNSRAFSGVLGLRQVSPGQLISAGTIITTLDESPNQSGFSLPEVQLARLKTGLLRSTKRFLSRSVFNGRVISVDSRSLWPAVRLPLRRKSIIPTTHFVRVCCWKSM